LTRSKDGGNCKNIATQSRYFWQDYGALLAPIAERETMTPEERPVQAEWSGDNDTGKNKTREEFPQLRAGKNVSVKSRLGAGKPITKPGVNHNKANKKTDTATKSTVAKTRTKILDKAKSAKADTRFKVVAGNDAWLEVRKSVEQKLSGPPHTHIQK